MNDFQQSFDPSNRHEINDFVTKHSASTPDVCDPEHPMPIGDVGVLPGDVLATSDRVQLVVDVIGDYAVCYTVGEERYAVYTDELINETLEFGTHYHADIVAGDSE